MTRDHLAELSLLNLRRILRATELASRGQAHASGLPPTQLRALQTLGEQGIMTPSALALRMGVSQATVTTLMEKLVARGLVQRSPSEHDRRQTDLAITETGRARLIDAPDALMLRYAQAFNRLEDWEQAALVSALERVAGMLEG